MRAYVRAYVRAYACVVRALFRLRVNMCEYIHACMRLFACSRYAYANEGS